jgi:hypothetical protein
MGVFLEVCEAQYWSVVLRGISARCMFFVQMNSQCNPCTVSAASACTSRSLHSHVLGLVGCAKEVLLLLPEYIGLVATAGCQWAERLLFSCRC